MTTFPTNIPPALGAAATTALGDASHDHDQHHLDIDQRLGQLEPSLASRLALSTTSPPTGNASGAMAVISFPLPGSVFEQVGTDVTVNSGDTTKIDVVTAGVYSLFVMMIVQNAVLTFADFNVGNFDPFAGIGLGFSMTDRLAGVWASTFAETYHLPAPTSLQFSVQAETDDASTWDVLDVEVRVQRIL